MTDTEIRETMKSLNVGEKVQITFSKNRSLKTSTFTVDSDSASRNSETDGLSVGIISKGTPYGNLRGMGGSISDYGDAIVFQPTMTTQVQDVLNLERVA